MSRSQGRMAPVILYVNDASAPKTNSKADVTICGKPIIPETGWLGQAALPWCWSTPGRPGLP